MEKLGFHRVSNSPNMPGQPTISHSRPNQPDAPLAPQLPPSPAFKRQFEVANGPNNRVALSNCIGVNPRDFADFPNRAPLLLDGNYVCTLEKEETVAPGTIGLAANVRLWGKWSLTQTILVESYNIFLGKQQQQQQYLGGLEILIDFHVKSKANSNPVKHEELVDIFINNYQNQILQPTQKIVMEFKGIIYGLLIHSVQVIDLNSKEKLPSIKESSDLSVKGILIKQTEVIFYPNENSIINLAKPSSLKGKRIGGGGAGRPRARKQIINPDFKLEDLGIGGLDAEFQDIFRRAFNSRILPPEIAERLDYKHCKGLLLFGPPGTGKTLIARKLSKMLNGKEPKIVNGPEMLSKYVGASEENIRNLFKEAEAEYKQKGDDSDLHVIIFDELDSVFKQRGSAKSDGTGVGDNVVNQLLSKMDGVDQLNNILIIGMTNRLDLIDSALLRPGRFEIQIEIALPDEKGRKDILLIHTAKLKENNLLTKDVDFDELAGLTKNFTGAELEGLCNSAKSFAISRHTKSGSVAQIDAATIDKMQITRNDFLLAFSEVKPAFGTDEEDLTLAAPHGIIPFNSSIKNIFDRGQSFIDEVKSSETETLISVLVHGPSGVGKTAIAATLALNSDFPFIKMLSAESMVGMSEPAKIQYIDNVFRDVYKSPLNILVIDKIETLINYVPIGPRFSNEILQLLMVYLTKKPPKGRRLLIIGTTSQYSVLKHMNLIDCFTNTVAVPSIRSVEEIGRVLTKIGYMSQEAEKNDILSQLSSFEINIGIKRLLQVLMNSKYLKSDANGVVENIIDAHNV
ncbi:cytoplasmic protein [Suhomyces tanzawaensis NRRL Y-17324]|uniref:Vesicular-fusion protein SEC18 n=1 Tax=Suhomyces tanzawaensis NRRL Y-17324 TaxID=984487 RepID=A0A1E4SFJ3_9ASCO|nr:cytoplasmic protein [Suhomyces tanzawaensis NRRL Y-17324]ODV78283.1 cytoplasmic protein [Suhomyces tanzawaensis NRRL Y-17324]